MAKKQKPELRQKMFKATFYVSVDENKVGEVVTAEAVKEFLSDALIVDVDTEEWDDTIGFQSAEVNIESLEEIVPVGVSTARNFPVPNYAESVNRTETRNGLLDSRP